MNIRFIIIFMLSSSDGNYTPSPGDTEEPYLIKMSGYGLIFRGGSTNPRIHMIAYSNNYPPDGSSEYLLDNPLSGNHHFDITRFNKGQFYVYHNNALIINYLHTATSSSEKFMFVSWLGAPRIDNISVGSPTKTTTTTTTANESTSLATMSIILGSIMILVVVRRKNRN